MKYWRRLPQFEYVAPGSLKEVCSLLREKGGTARVMAGGTVLLARWKERLGVCPHLISLKKVTNLDAVDFSEKSGVTIGAMATLKKVNQSPLLQQRFTPLAMACGGIASPQIRNMGTVGGNLCCRYPTAETVPPLVALGAKVKLVKSDGERVITVEELYQGALKDEVVAEIQIPPLPSKSGGTYLKYTLREALDYPIVNVAVVVTLEKDNCKDVRIAVGATAPFPFRTRKAEELIKGNSLKEEMVKRAGQSVWEEVTPSSDAFFSGEYKKQLIRVLTERALRLSCERAKAANI